MKIITCTGYYGTGSSAVTDFFSEFSSCSSIGEYEVRFIHDPNGIRDLEYNIIENNNRHNTSHAIKNFKRYVDYLNGTLIKKRYRKYCGDNFLKLSYEYINNITELCCNASWHFDSIDKGELFALVDSVYIRICRLLKIGSDPSLLMHANEKSYFSTIDKETFYYYTKKYIYDVLQCMRKQDSEYIMVDQLLPPSNINQYLHYFDYIKVFIVDRDPRDIFILSSALWKTNVVPYKNIEEFCKWYEIIRRHQKHEKINTEYSAFIHFEDLIYKYEDTTEKLMKFVGINPKDHIIPRSYLNPAVSIKNTNLKHKYPEYKKEIEYIENHLQEYLYEFPSDNN